MNKKIIVIILGILLFIGLTIFIIVNNDTADERKNNENNAKEVLDNSKRDNNTKTLVVYFSRAGEVYNVGEVEVGNTALMSSYVVDYLNADSFEIIPVKSYSRKYNDLIKQAKEEQNTNERPEIKYKLENLDKYDTIFIGYPIWWGDLPSIVYTFLESYDFKDKKIIPFNTHEGSGSANTYNTIKNKLTNANVITNGLALQGKTARTNNGKEQTINWLKELGY